MQSLRRTRDSGKKAKGRRGKNQSKVLLKLPKGARGKSGSSPRRKTPRDPVVDYEALHKFFDASGLTIKILSREDPLDFCERWYAQFDGVRVTTSARLTGGDTPEKAVLALLMANKGSLVTYSRLRPASTWVGDSRRDWFETSILVPQLYK